MARVILKQPRLESYQLSFEIVGRNYTATGKNSAEIEIDLEAQSSITWSWRRQAFALDERRPFDESLVESCFRKIPLLTAQVLKEASIQECVCGVFGVYRSLGELLVQDVQGDGNL